MTHNLLKQEELDGAKKILSTTKLTRVVTEETAKEILAGYGIKIPKFSFAANENDAVQKARALGFPLVGKIISPEILHKTDLNAIKMGVNSEAELRRWLDDVYGRLSKQYDVKGVLLEEMVASGIELIVSLQHDRQFGPVIMVGLGGIYAEIFRDVQFRVLPIDKHDALEMIENLKWRQLLNGFRNHKAINLDMLTDVILRISNLGTGLVDYYESIEINPLIAHPNDYRVVDAKMILREKPKTQAISVASPDLRHLDLFFNATSIALVGASPEFGKVGNSILQKLLQGNSNKKIFPVSPEGYPEIMGVKAYKHIEQIAERIDLVVVATDLKTVPAIMESCHGKNIHNMVILSGGGKEIGGEHGAIEHRINLLARKYDIRVIGPNCIGLFNNKNLLDCLFQGHGKTIERPARGNIAFLSQSGTFGAAFMESSCDALGVSKVVTYGNRSNVDEADMIWYLANDPETKVIGLYFEGLEDGRKFMETAKRVIKEKGKPIVAFKNNRTSHAGKQSALHNGSLAHSYEITKGALDQSGIVSVDSYEELVASLKALTLQPVPTGSKIAMVTNGGGAVVAALDQIENDHLSIAPISELTRRSFTEYYPPTYAVGNPCDLTCVATATDYEFAIRKFLQDPNVDIIVVWFVPWFVLQDHPLKRDHIIEVLTKFQRQRKKPILVGTYSQTFSKGVSKNIEKHGIPVYHSVMTCMTAASSLARWSQIMKM
jgi:3-hydroxypropionyl-CoA synthetase (ADP-forming)